MRNDCEPSWICGIFARTAATSADSTFPVQSNPRVCDWHTSVLLSESFKVKQHERGKVYALRLDFCKGLEYGTWEPSKTELKEVLPTSMNCLGKIGRVYTLRPNI